MTRKKLHKNDEKRARVLCQPGHQSEREHSRRNGTPIGGNYVQYHFDSNDEFRPMCIACMYMYVHACVLIEFVRFVLMLKTYQQSGPNFSSSGNAVDKLSGSREFGSQTSIGVALSNLMGTGVLPYPLLLPFAVLFLPRPELPEGPLQLTQVSLWSVFQLVSLHQMLQ